ncbi:MFS family permease [Kutzneria viridogrisea]|uniref:MFS family permease n=1 Tax=Kutzneria viridogrisea TaxID=47990 RepID=A0ABR6BPF2_9PSEU|nr:MFS family permease [Kutzneria viridogrisea]
MSTVGALRHRDYRWLVAGRAVNYLGNGVAPIALSFAVLDLTGSVADLGVVVGTRSLANVALLLLGGVLADRLPRGVLLQGTNFGAALSQALVALSVLTGHASIPLLIVLSACNGALAAVAMPGSAALVPQTVPKELLRPANALNRIANNTAMILGASLGGLLVAAVGPGWGIAVDAVLFLLAAGCFATIRIAAPAREASSALADLREGWTEFTARTWVWVVVLQFMVVNAASSGGISVLGPVVADHSFGRSGWGVVMAGFTVGALLGGLLATRWQPRRALLVGVLLTFVNAVPLVALAVQPGVVVLAVCMGLMGVAAEVFTVAWDVSLQENVPPDRLARVYSYDALGSCVALPLGEVAAGPVAASVGVAPTLLGAAALVLAATGLALCSREVRGLVVRGQEQVSSAPAQSA